MTQPPFKNHKNWHSINILQNIILLQGAHLLQTRRVQWRSGVADGEIVAPCPRFKRIHRGRDLWLSFTVSASALQPKSYTRCHFFGRLIIQGDKCFWWVFLGCSLGKGLQRSWAPSHTPSAMGGCVTWSPCPRNTRTGISITSEERVVPAREYK